MKTAAFYKTKTLEQMTTAEWESLCDGCGLCCLQKLEDEDTGDIFVTAVACRLLDAETCQCSDYLHRKSIVPDCLQLDIAMVRSVRWLPKTCAYKLVDGGEELPNWHYLISHSRNSVHQAHISARDKIMIHEDEIRLQDDYLNYIIGPVDA
ncbi:YcgN family cysteine cluster protein [uncultured Bartonella sp.]|uniref:YcgN family cysteine cluster protein n=1 Tax=uncultured Bartonella sp. TaxID=104108 RepID=UPI00260F7A9E|nr:YcgN family cysteine cluster protein [uncultured Bartonella sp.]